MSLGVVPLTASVAPLVTFVTYSSCHSNRGRKPFQELFHRENATNKNEVKTHILSRNIFLKC